MNHILVLKLLSCGNLKYFVAFTFLISQAQAQNITLSGYVEESGSGEKLIGANLVDLATQQGATTNEYGFYSLTLPIDSGHLVVSYVGYQRDTIAWTAEEDVNIDVRLRRAIQLETVEIQA